MQIRPIFVPAQPPTDQTPPTSQHAAISTVPQDVPSVNAPFGTSVRLAKDPIPITYADQLISNFVPLPYKPKTPLLVNNFLHELQYYPDQTFASYLIHSLRFGFDIGYNGPEFSNHTRNLTSAKKHPQIITENLITELKAGRMVGPFARPPLPYFRTSIIGVVPKKDNAKFRTITDLSSPRGTSINDFISTEESTVQLNGFDCAVEIVSKLGKLGVHGKTGRKKRISYMSGTSRRLALTGFHISRILLRRPLFALWAPLLCK